MLPAVRPLLFADHRIVELVEGGGEFRHEFGGPIAHRGARLQDCRGHRLHLLYQIDQSDPLVPLRLPHLDRIPLYYSFDFCMTEVGYRCLEDGTIKVHLRRGTGLAPDENGFPTDDYPESFPVRPIHLKSVPYDPTRLEDAYTFAGVFGISKLAPRLRKQLIARERK